MVSKEVLERIPRFIIDEVGKFAENYNKSLSNPKEVQIQQIWYSDGDLEEERDTLFFITPPKYLDDLENAISKFECDIMQKRNFNLHIQTWLCGEDNSENYGFNEKLFDYSSPSK
ncbi:MAG: hypothetical protein AABW67_01085 [Nanoarchaeota archaeon]